MLVLVLVVIEFILFLFLNLVFLCLVLGGRGDLGVLWFVEEFWVL